MKDIEILSKICQMIYTKDVETFTFIISFYFGFHPTSLSTLIDLF